MTVGPVTARLGLLKEAVVNPRTMRTFANYARLGGLAKFLTTLCCDALYMLSVDNAHCMAFCFLNLPKLLTLVCVGSQRQPFS